MHGRLIGPGQVGPSSPNKNHVEKRMINRKHISDVLLEGKSLRNMKGQAVQGVGLFDSALATRQF